ncbi:lipopolysaccharide export system permease protein [Siphonobacter aquaeclarae]|jgi:lipopolysaccharide export system permease protein|uniref:Lipopolysaccharide export system permease protein n=2 Tax=Siphonobacter aquaeclarae TaxID=563176 RepID=A0A1G9RPW5_9BACT|nr:lipopolysaccharide export system permease protein [Siphonobacter aquaeclarae]
MPQTGVYLKRIVMRKLDKLVLGAFWGPFVVTFAVTEFIFLTRFILLYFDEIAGRDVGLDVYGRLFFYFSLMVVPVSMPLAVLLSSLMCFGNLGEFSELTAVKSAGISISRVIRPVAIVIFFITGFILWFNNTIQPWANLKGYSMLWDIKTTKATLAFKEGIFNDDLPNFSIKVSKKYADGSLKNVIIYNHSGNNGNRAVTIADSARTYMILDGKYLVFELFNGADYVEDVDKTSPNLNTTDFAKNAFRHKKEYINMRAFKMNPTDEEQFKNHAIMKSLGELRKDGDSLKANYDLAMKGMLQMAPQYYSYHLQPQSEVAKKMSRKWVDSLVTAREKAFYGTKNVRPDQLTNALNSAKSRFTAIETDELLMYDRRKNIYKNDLEWNHKFTSAISCLVMFLIGAPLGSIIKKGGFGLPVLVAIIFFILMYVLTIQGDKYAKEGTMWVPLGAWMSNLVLFGFGVYFMIKALNDSRLFEADVYRIAFNRWKEKFEAWRETAPVIGKKRELS